MEFETRSFYTPTKLVRISSTQNDPNISRNSLDFFSLAFCFLVEGISKVQCSGTIIFELLFVNQIELRERITEQECSENSLLSNSFVIAGLYIRISNYVLWTTRVNYIY